MEADEIRRQFIAEYQRVQPTSRLVYDRRRGDGMPCAATVIERCGFRTWTELLAACGLEKITWTGRKPGPAFSVTYRSDMEERLREVERRIAREQEAERHCE